MSSTVKKAKPTNYFGNWDKDYYKIKGIIAERESIAEELERICNELEQHFPWDVGVKPSASVRELRALAKELQ